MLTEYQQDCIFYSHTLFSMTMRSMIKVLRTAFIHVQILLKVRSILNEEKTTWPVCRKRSVDQFSTESLLPAGWHRSVKCSSCLWGVWGWVYNCFSEWKLSWKEILEQYQWIRHASIFKSHPAKTCTHREMLGGQCRPCAVFCFTLKTQYETMHHPLWAN